MAFYQKKLNFVFHQISMEISEKELSSVYKIRFIDCDPLGHLRNSKYIDYMLNAREDHFEIQSPFNYAELTKKTNCAWVVVKNEIAYIKEVRMNESVSISSKLIQIDHRTAKIEMIMTNLKNNKISSVLWCTVINFNLITRKSEDYAPFITDIFKDFVIPIDSDNFDERVDFLKLDSI